MKFSLFLALIAVVAIAGCTSGSRTDVFLSAGSGQKTVHVEIADSSEEWRTGLMNRDFLGEDSGMLFVFPDSQPRSFWMKDTLIPLDIIFVSEDYKIVDITTMQPCRADPCPSYRSKAPARYVLEVNAGYTRDNNITIGSGILVQYSS